MTHLFIGEVETGQHGIVLAYRTEYEAGGLCVVLLDPDEEELIAKLSVWLEPSPQLPKDHFYAKTWGENQEIAQDCLDSGLFEPAENYPVIATGYVTANVWKVKES